MKTTIRPLTIIFSLVLLTVFGAAPYFVFFNSQQIRINVATVAAAAMTILFLAGLFSIARLTLFIHIDHTNQIITFTYPFRFQRLTFDFKDIIGFRYKYLMARIDYKAIQIKTKDGRKFTISDFETANLRKFETHALNTFELRSADDFSPLDEEAKKIEVESSREFDFNQAKAIRDLLFIGIFAIVLIIVINFFDNNGPLSTGKITFYSVLIALVICMIYKLVKTIHIVKKGSYKP